MRKDGLTVNGVKYKNLTDAGKAYGISIQLIERRLGFGWPLNKAITEPKKRNRMPLFIDGSKFDSLRQAVLHYGISYTYAYNAVKAGKSIDEIFNI